MEEILEKLKKGTISFLKAISIPALCVSVIVALLAGVFYFILKNDGSYKEGDKKNTPYAVEEHTNNIDIDGEGNIVTNMTAQELWDQMVKDGSRVDKYLNGPEELNKLINAQLITDYMDTRPNPNEEIDWEALNKDVESGKVQGIIKLKRAQNDGTTSTLTYMDPDSFQLYIDEYNDTGSETAKEIVLSHFTLEKGYKASNAGGNYETGTDGVAKIIEAGDTIEIPEGQGYGTKYIYNAWQTITEPSSNQYKLIQKAGGFTFDEEGFGRINGRYAVAMTETYKMQDCEHRGVGNYIDYYYKDENGVEKMIPCIIVDIKSSSHVDSPYGHFGGSNILEFYVNEVTWTTPNWNSGIPGHVNIGQASSMHVNPGTNGFKTEWIGAATKIVNGGCYFDNPNFVDGKIEENEPSKGDNSEEKPDTTDEEENEVTNETVLCWPLAVDGTITSRFGPRNAPTSGASTNHKGIDIGVAVGTDVYATESGKVIGAGEAGAAGIMVTIDHGNGYMSKYMHCSQILVSVGETVQKGQVIAKSGNTGTSTGPHLHFQIEFNGNAVDPESFKYSNGWGDGSGGIGCNPGEVSTTSDFYVKVATWSEETEIITSDDPEQETKEPETIFRMTSTKIDYRKLVSGYRMPFDYLWALVVIAQDNEFVFDLADLVYNSEIEITVHDNLTVSTNVAVDTYTKKTKVITDNIKVQVNFEEETKTEIGGPLEAEVSNDYTITTTNIIKTNTLDVQLTKANVWIVDYLQKFTQQKQSPQKTSSSNEIDDEEYPEEPDREDYLDPFGLGQSYSIEVRNKYLSLYPDVQTKLVDSRSKIYNKIINRKIDVTNTIETTKYISSPADIKEKVDKESKEENFVTLFIKHRKARENIIDGLKILVEILNSSEDTVDMIDLTKYLIYEATGTKTGVKEFDFSIFDPKNFKSPSGQYGGNSNIEGVQGQIYDFLLGRGVPPVGAAAILGNIQGESGFNSAAVNYLGCSGLCQWYQGRLEGLKRLADSRGVPWTDVDTQLEYMWNELESSSYADVRNVIMNATEEEDLEYAVWYWGRYYEVYFLGDDFESTKHNSATRYQYAQKWYNEFEEKSS